MATSKKSGGCKPCFCLGCGRVRRVQGGNATGLGCVCGKTDYRLITYEQAIACQRLKILAQRIIWFNQGRRIEKVAGRKQWLAVWTK